jgi:hypothetical protein
MFSSCYYGERLFNKISNILNNCNKLTKNGKILQYLGYTDFDKIYFIKKKKQNNNNHGLDFY